MSNNIFLRETTEGYDGQKKEKIDMCICKMILRYSFKITLYTPNETNYTSRDTVEQDFEKGSGG